MSMSRVMRSHNVRRGTVMQAEASLCAYFLMNAFIRRQHYERQSVVLGAESGSGHIDQ